MSSNSITLDVNTVKEDVDEGEGRKHNHRGRFRLTKTISLIMMLFLTTSFFVVELVVGHITNSNSLIADAFHMLSDVISLVIGLVALRYTKVTSTKYNTFGWVRAEILGSLVNSVFLLALCFSIVVEAITRFFDPPTLKNIDLMLIVGGIGLGINLIGLIIFGSHGHSHGADDHGHTHGGTGGTDDHGHSHGTVNQSYEASQLDVTSVAVVTATGKKQKKRFISNMNIHGVFLHVLSDALGSIAVLISGLLIKYAPPTDNTEAKWKLYIDPVLSLVITIIITVSTLPLLKRSSHVLLQSVPRQFDMDSLRTLIKNVNGVLGIHHFHVWSLNTDKYIASAHLRVLKDDEYKTLVNVKRLLHDHDIHSTTLQLEFDDHHHHSLQPQANQHHYDYCEADLCKTKQCCDEDTNQYKIATATTPLSQATQKTNVFLTEF